MIFLILWKVRATRRIYLKAVREETLRSLIYTPPLIRRQTPARARSRAPRALELRAPPHRAQIWRPPPLLRRQEAAAVADISFLGYWTEIGAGWSPRRGISTESRGWHFCCPRPPAHAALHVRARASHLLGDLCAPTAAAAGSYGEDGPVPCSWARTRPAMRGAPRPD